MVTWKVSFSEIWQIWANFSMENIFLYWSKSYFSGGNLAKFGQKK
jgi:hypothetical protein